MSRAPGEKPREGMTDIGCRACGRPLYEGDVLDRLCSAWSSTDRPSCLRRFSKFAHERGVFATLNVNGDVTGSNETSYFFDVRDPHVVVLLDEWLSTL